MTSSNDHSVCVIIAAYNGEQTIARAVASALREPEVSEVVLVDDASTDETAARAAAADDGTGRLRILRHSGNRGPSAARNLALASSSAPLVTVLDADDFFVPGRFTRLLATRDWDMVADNIAFVPEDDMPDFAFGKLRTFTAEGWWMELSRFVEKNIPTPGVARGELGFLKPVIRRSLLTDANLTYDEKLRLGEDFILYCGALAAGARFRLVPHCGYVAIERPESLSGRHRTADLAALASAHDGLLAMPRLSQADRRIMRRHRGHVLRKLDHRDFLDRKHGLGLGTALKAYISRPVALFRIGLDVARDKLQRRRILTARKQQGLRYLFE